MADGALVGQACSDGVWFIKVSDGGELWRTGLFLVEGFGTREDGSLLMAVGDLKTMGHEAGVILKQRASPTEAPVYRRARNTKALAEYGEEMGYPHVYLQNSSGSWVRQEGWSPDDQPIWRDVRTLLKQSQKGVRIARSVKSAMWRAAWEAAWEAVINTAWDAAAVEYEARRAGRAPLPTKDEDDTDGRTPVTVEIL